MLYVWNFGDNTPEVSTYDNALRHNFASAGTYTITVKATNLLGSQSMSNQVNIYQLIELESLTVPTTDKPTQPVTAKVDVKAGTDMSFQWLLDGVELTFSSPASSTAQITFGQSGTHNVTVVVSNPVDSQSLQKIVQVTSAVTGNLKMLASLLCLNRISK